MKKTILVLLIICFSCSSKDQTDSELLEKDKQALSESLDSYKVTSYKFGKILIRASATEDSNTPEFKSFKSDLDRIFNTALKYNIDNTKSLSLLDYISIYRDYKKMEDFIEDTDEDVFPTLVESFNSVYGDSTQTKQPLLKGKEKEYVQNIEHSILSAVVLLSKDLGKEVSLYECSKTQPELLPDSEIKTLLQYLRGFIFFEKGLHYLSENEISNNINWLNDNKNIDLPYTRSLFKWGDLDNQQTHTAFHSLNHLFRGFDRLMMDRDIDEKRALEDFEIFLKDSKEIGLDNEVIWSIETYLHLKNEDSEKAITSLTRLRSSSLLTSRDKKSIDESIGYLKNREPGKVLNGFYDNYFLSKIATKYIFSLLAAVDWQQVMEDQNVPHTKEMFETIEKIKHLRDNLDKYTSTENLKDAGKTIKNKGKNLWDKAKSLTD